MKQMDEVEQAITIWETRRDEGFAVALCAVCGHPWFGHYTMAVGESAGCVADRPPAPTIRSMWVGDPVPPSVATSAGRCLCPGYEQGHLPYNITKHLPCVLSECGWYEDHEGDDPPACPSGACRHGLDFHGGGYGCWECSCPVDTAADVRGNGGTL